MNVSLMILKVEPMKKILFYSILVLCFPLISFCQAAGPDAGSALPQSGLVSAGYRTLKAPPGFKIALFAEGVDDARSLTRGDKGAIFVGTRQGKVYALVDRNRDGKSDETIVIAKGLNSPNGVAFRNGSLYVAEINRILRFDQIESKLKHPPKPVVIRDDLPTEGHHGWKFIAFGPDGKLYVPVGAPCNVCNRTDGPYATILRMDPDGSHQEVFARGIRNTVGFAWHPTTKQLWFTENGRDLMGDDVPPDELNVAPNLGLHFGFPYCHAGTIKDPDHNEGKDCASFKAPAWKFDSHVAALGTRFYTATQFPKAFHNRLIVAQHGSWNRTVPLGYRLVTVALKGSKAVASEIFIDGWLKDGKAWGRPVDVLVMPDGALLVSDDEAGVVYRVSYKI